MTTKIQSISPDTADVTIGGYSPVSYFEEGRAERGNEAFHVIQDGRAYYLTSADQVATFRSNPDKYVPAYGGWCAYGMTVEQNFPIDPENFKIVDGRLLLFLRNEEVDALELWSKEDEHTCVTKAERFWNPTVGTTRS